LAESYFFITFAVMKHIRIISPSGSIDPNYITLSKARLESWGFRVTVGTYAYGQNGRFSGTEDERLSDLNEAFADESIDIILCSRGGYGLQQIADQIVLPSRPTGEWPLVVGFSDITILHALMSRHGVRSLHASMCKALATLPDDHPVLEQMRQALIDEKSAKRFDKPVVGGNLSVLYGLQGTSYSLNAIIDECEEAPILLLEDVCERHYHIDRMLNNLRLSGVLSRISGVIVGQFTDCNDDAKMGCTLRESIVRVLSEYDYPVEWDAPYGHVDENEPILLSYKKK
jgi:muramoyltetrapeptide carboxypeptidase